MPANPQDLERIAWDDVRVFLAVFREKTLGAAGRRLRLDTSTVSRRLSAFELALGLRLFDRSREGLVPTRGARQLLPAAEAMEAAHGRLARDASDVEATAEGVVRLSVAPGVADHFVSPLLGKLRGQHPRIAIELDASTRPLDLSRHEADLALRSVPPQGAELLITKLGTARWVVAGAPGQVRALGRLSSWSDAPWIAWDRDMSSLAPAQWLAKHAPRAEVALRTSLFTSQVIAAEVGVGLVFVPEPHLLRRGLVPVRYAPALQRSVDAWPEDTLWLVAHRASREVPRVAAVWKFLAAELRQVFGARAGKRD